MEIFREKEGQLSELKELKAKYENIKQLNLKEYNSRKEKEQKLDQCNGELEKKN